MDKDTRNSVDMRTVLALLEDQLIFEGVIRLDKDARGFIATWSRRARASVQAISDRSMADAIVILSGNMMQVHDGD